MVENAVEGMVEVAIDEAVKGIIIIIAESMIAKTENRRIYVLVIV